jgi:2-methylisocitrate lyase-like PEP mutase family enzyme
MLRSVSESAAGAARSLRSAPKRPLASVGIRDRSGRAAWPAGLRNDEGSWAHVSFADLHRGSRPLLLPNAWDVPSALAFAEAGFTAIGTTSFGVASSLGRPDGSRATAAANLTLARQLSALGCYLTVDIEDGYFDDPAAVASYAEQLGVAGINIEDSVAGRLISPAAQAAKIAAIKDRQPDLFVNARVDTYWLGQDATLSETLGRAARYVDAGADGIFVPGPAEPELLRELASGIPAPLNVLVIPALSLDELAGLGVRRVSTGSLPYRAAMRAAAAAAAAVRDGQPVPAAEPYPELQGRLVRYAQSAGRSPGDPPAGAG